MSCLALGWPFVGAGCETVQNLPGQIWELPLKTVVRASLPMLLGFFFWAVAASFLLSTAIKIDFPGKFERHFPKVVFVRNVAMACLWLTVPIAVLWVAANIFVA
jgi:hypothetical protein